jgi:hypothetical protein
MDSEIIDDVDPGPIWVEVSDLRVKHPRDPPLGSLRAVRDDDKYGPLIEVHVGKARQNLVRNQNVATVQPAERR